MGKGIWQKREVGLVFGRMRKTHTQQMRDEILETYGHLRAAAAHAAGAGAEKLTPPYDKARHVADRSWQTTKVALGPLYDSMRDGARSARSGMPTRSAQNSPKSRNPPKSRKVPIMLGLLAAGATAGAAAAMIARRHRATAHWDAYEPARALDDTDTGYDEIRDDAEKVVDSTRGKVTSATKKVTAGAAAVADTVSTQAGKIAETLHHKSAEAQRLLEDATKAVGEASEEVRRTADRHAANFSAFADETADEMVARASTIGKNSR